ncbi:P-type conjugative transfer protein TrbL [Brevundimonas diminuta]|jgi:type IV secretion system protein TrbL|uniref:P-type conjugative transfer protein TrbL n=1 Tax=Brevundimonas diminuta TaxID=293 RepID=UPI000B029D98
MAGPGMETPNELMVVFSNTVTAGFDALSGSVNGVFGLLIALVVALTGIQWALSPNREVLASGFGKVLLIGAFAWIINDWQALSETIYAGFLELGLTAGGGSLSREEFLNPGAILQQGWEIVKALGETPAPVENPLDVMGNVADALILGLAMIGIMLAFAILALQIIVSLLEFKIVTLGGFVLLPFGIWNKTAFLAERPLGYVVSSGLKVLALAIVVSGARTIFDQLQPSANPDIYEALTILVAALLLAMLAIFIPNLASALVTGGPALGAGAALTSGLAVAGAGALVAGGVAGAGAMAGRAAAIGGSSRSAAGAASAARSSGGGPSSGGAPSGGGPRPSPGPGPGSGPAGRTRDPAPSAGDAAPTSGGAAAPSSPTPAPSEAPPPQPDSSGPPPGKAGPQAETRSRPSLSEDRPLGGGAKGGRVAGRSAALQAFFIANSGRALMPAGENSGALKPTVRSED